MDLETKHLRFAPATLADLDEFVALYNDPEVVRYLGHGRVRSVEETRKGLENAVTWWRERGFGTWTVREKDTGKFVGRCGIQPLVDTGEVELGYVLHRNFWGRGLATEAAAAAVRFAFATVGLGRLAAIAYPENAASRRVIEKAGLKFEGIRPNPYPYRDVAWYGLSRAEYQSTNPGSSV